MSDTNIVVLKGRLARSAELRTLTNGTPCTSFVLAVGESRKDSSTGAWENVPHFFDVTTFSNYAKAAIASLTQGQEVLVTGRLQQNRWEKNGQKFFGVRVLAHELVNGLTTFVVGHFGDAARIYDADVCPLAATHTPHAVRLELPGHSGRLSEIQLAAKGEEGCELAI